MRKNYLFRVSSCFLCAVFFALLPTHLFSQNLKEIKGVVKSGSAPLAGISIAVKNDPKSGTTTDDKGEFTLRTSDNSVLLVSGIGYKSIEVPIGGSTSLNIAMEKDNTGLNEVVVVGYGTQRKATLTGAVTVVKGTSLQQSPGADVTSALAGRTPGVIATNNSGQPGSDGSKIYVRGISTYSGATDPLIVIDGVANRPGGFGHVDPNDIESISVLKDASAAIYGAQAANGVILITTKKGKTGKPTFTFNWNEGFNTWAKTEQYLNAAQYAQMANEISGFGGGAPVYTPEDIKKFSDGSDPIGHPNTNWLSLGTKEVALQDRGSITVSGGTENVKYYASIGKLDQNGQLSDGVWKYGQYNFNANIDAQVNKLLRIGFNTQLRWQDQEGSPIGVQNTFSSLTGALPTTLAINPNGSYATGGLSNGGVLNGLVNSTDLAGVSTLKSMYSLNTATARLDIPFVNGLFLDGFVAVDFGNVDSTVWNKSYQVYAYDPTADTYTPFTENASLGLASLDQLSSNSTTITENIKLNYQNQFGKSNIKAFVGYEQSTYKNQYVGAHKEQFISQAIPQLDYGSSTNQTNYGNELTSARQNVYGRINYIYDNKYLLEVQLRYDGSDVFSQSQRWGLFPSFSAGWIVSDYDWFKQSIPFISNLKLRGSWGKLGNDNIPPFQFAQFYYIRPTGRIFYNTGSGAQTIYPSFFPGVLGNPYATWESQTSTNLAIDAGLFNDKLTFTFEVFHQKRSNILAPPNASVPLYTGVTLPFENIGIVDNKGFEAQVGYHGTVGQVSYYISGNITYAQDHIVYQDEKLSSKPPYQSLTGQPVGAGLIYQAIGIYQSQADVASYATYTLGSTPIPGDLKFRDVNKDGVIDQKDQVVEPYSNVPHILYGFPIEFNYKGFSLNLLFQGQAQAARYFRAVSGKNQNFTIEDYEGRSTSTNITDKPRASEVYGSPQGIANTYYLSNTSFFRLKNCEIGYNFKAGGMSKYGVTALRVYANTFNLFTITPYKGLDPESVSGQGIGYPINRTFNLGASISF